MAQLPSNDLIEALKSSLRDLDKVQMIAPDDLKLLDQKREILKKIERAEPQATAVEKEP